MIRWVKNKDTGHFVGEYAVVFIRVRTPPATLLALFPGIFFSQIIRLSSL